MIDRAKAPISTAKIPFELPGVENYSLSNGLQVYFVRKEKLPVVYLSLLTSAGSKFDPAEKKGLAYLTSLLIDEGAGEFDALRLSDEFEKLGSIFNVSIDQDFVDLSLFSLKENFERSIYLLSKVLTEPRFEQKDFEREKKKVLDRILQLQDDAGYTASTVFERLIFKNSYYELPELGFEKSVNNISPPDVTGFYKNHFSNAGTKIFIVGNLEKENLLHHLENNLGKWKNGSNSSIEFTPEEREETKYYIIDKKDSAQCEIRIGHIAKKRNSVDYYATRLMNTILGGQFSSRINLNLREAKGFTYGANSAFSFYQQTGLFEVHTAVNIENTGAAVKEIFNELTGIRADITKKEIEFAKSNLIKQYPSRFETYAQITKNIESIVLHSLSFDEMNRYEEILDKVTDDEIKKSAIENIFPGQAVVVLCGEKDKIEPQLANELGVSAITLDNEGNRII
jgi:zinc protease